MEPRRRSKTMGDGVMDAGCFGALDCCGLADSNVFPMLADLFDEGTGYSFAFTDGPLRQDAVAQAAARQWLKRATVPVAYTQPSERSKKRKTAHRHVRSPSLLFHPPKSSPPPAAAISARLFASSTAQEGKETRMAPTESRWTGDSAAWLEAEASLARLTLTENDVALDHGSSPLVNASTGRVRSNSAPPALMATDWPVALSSMTCDATPEMLKAQLLSILRMRTPDGGGRVGDAALKLRRWVHYNSWRRAVSVPVPTSPTSVGDQAGDIVYAAGKRAPSALSVAMARQTPSAGDITDAALTSEPAEMAASEERPIGLRLRLQRPALKSSSSSDARSSDATLEAVSPRKRKPTTRATSAPPPDSRSGTPPPTRSRTLKQRQAMAKGDPLHSASNLPESVGPSRLAVVCVA